MKALIIDRVSPLVESGLKEYGVDVDVKILPGVDELKRLLPEYDLLVMRVDPKIDRELLDAAAKRVKMIAVCSAGTNHIDLEYAKQLGIRIQNAPGINCNAVAELTISKLLDVSRFTMEANREVQEDHIWNKYKYTGHELKGHTLGVIGLGKIGSRVAQLAQAFGMTVKAYDPYVDGAVMAEKGVEKVDSVLELCSQADYLTVHTPLTVETKGIVGAKELAAMKDGSIVVNCARGGLTDTEALIEGIESMQIGALGMDTAEGEEGIIHCDRRSDIIANRNWFYLHQFRNVIMTQHMAFYTEQAVDSMVQCGIEGIVKMAEEGTYPTMLD